MDAGTSAAVIAGITVTGKPAAELVKEFVGRIFGPTADAAGIALAYPIVEFNKRRAERGEKLLLRSAEIIVERGCEAKAIPDALLLPLLTHGSLADEEDLQATWAALLASAALADGTPKVTPSFPAILAELSAEEVRVLAGWHSYLSRQRHQPPYLDGLAVGFDSGEGSDNYTTRAIIRDNLIRLRLLEETGIVMDGRELREAVGQLLASSGSQFPMFIKMNERRKYELRVTHLGWAFMEACAGPKARGPEDP